MRADKRTLVTLSAGVLIPFGNHYSNAALLVCGCAQFKSTVNMINECRYRQRVAVHLVNRFENGLNHLHGLFSAAELAVSSSICCVSPCSRNVYLDKCGNACIDCLVVHVNDILTFLEVGLGCSVLHMLNSLFDRHNLCQSKESSLKDRIGTLAHADLFSKVDSVYSIELDVVLCDILLCFSVEVLIQIFCAPLAVDEEYAAGLNILHHLVAFEDIRRVMAGNKVSLIDIIGALDRLVTKTQVRDRYAACFL